MIKRQLQEVLEGKMFQGKAIILIGARQVGKSTLFKQILDQNKETQVLSLNCDEPEVQELLSNANTSQLKMLIGNNKIVFIDEAQRLNDVGIILKRIIDNMPDVQLLVTGSSSFELHNRLNEPLTGRKYEYHLYPVSTRELLETNGLLNVKQTLEYRLIYGSYPDILNHEEEAKELIMNISDSYLYKDLLSLDNIRRPALLDKILKALALQLGSEVKYNEIAQLVGTDNKTVEKYIDLLEKCYVIFRLDALSRNVRNELKKGKKVYFWDNGVRNAVIQNFAPINLRQDMGALWENFIISERLKSNHYSRRYVQSYFWRTTSQQEIDYIEEEDGLFTALEMKWNPKRSTINLPKAFLDNYPIRQSSVITPDNYLEYII